MTPMFIEAPVVAHAATQAGVSTSPHRFAVVLSYSLAVVWPDGSRIDLHPVQQGIGPKPLHRALQVDGAWAVLPLDRALPHVADDIRVSARRDHHGLIWWALTRSGRWASAAAFLAWVRPHLQDLSPPLQGVDA